MTKYRIPIQAISYTEVEASTLEEAVLDINNGDPDIPGIILSQVDSWEIDQWRPFCKNDEEVVDNNGETLYLSDILDHTKY